MTGDIDKLLASLEADPARFASAREDALALAQELFKRARTMLEWPIYESKTVTDAKGQVFILTPARWRQADIHGMARTGLLLQQFALTTNKAGDATPYIQTVFDRVRREAEAVSAPEFEIPGIEKNPFGEGGEHYVDLPKVEQ